ncbi:MAG: hypothetical protein IPJ01_12780 [Micavibrio sp.]|nr:hypothetical protein [Micavibrio sp.]
MGTIYLATGFAGVVGGVQRRSQRDAGECVAIECGSDKCDDSTFSVAAAGGTATLWDASSSACGDFDFLCIETDVEIVLELITDANNGVGREEFTVTVIPDVPFVLASKQSYANYTLAFAAGTLDVIDKITCKNLHATAAATVRRFIAT